MNTNLQSLIRALLSALGAFLIGHAIWKTPITTSFWDDFTGIVIAVGSLIWGIKSKTATVEMLEATAKSVITFAGGLFVTAGVLSSDQLVTIVAFGSMLAGYVFSAASKKKVQIIANNPNKVAQLGK